MSIVGTRPPLISETNLYEPRHVHNRDVINWQNNRHSMTTLVSGIGWPEGSDLHSAPHVYSCYEKGITFKYVTEEKAEAYLTDINNYLRTAAYRQNYSKYTRGVNTGKYIKRAFLKTMMFDKKDNKFAYMEYATGRKVHNE